MGEGGGPRAGVRVFDVNLGEEVVRVVSVPATHAPAATLTLAEREVVELALEGRSNAEIARRRGTSARTIANQLASTYRKLSVSGRAELAASRGRK